MECRSCLSSTQILKSVAMVLNLFLGKETSHNSIGKRFHRASFRDGALPRSKDIPVVKQGHW